MEGTDQKNLACLGERGAADAQLEQCPGCLAFLPLSEFCDLDVGLEPDDPLPHCAKCRREGIPQPKFLNLTRRQLKAMELVLAGTSVARGIAEAVKQTGYSSSHIREMLNGRRHPEVRRCYQLALESAGGDIRKVIQVQVEALDAKEAKYHPKNEEFVEFPDYRTRLRASQHIGKMLELEPPRQDKLNVIIPITFNTNLGDGKTFDPPNVMRARPTGEIVDVSDA